ncbi:MAG: hypothetical protein OIF50_00720 [Flavobacteriaceae bacterium]|nr:hypothetical protein [Flavobacteriaceae bacterium]
MANIPQEDQNDLRDLPVYRQALSLFQLGRGLGVVLTNNKSIQQMHSSQHATDQQTSLLIMNVLLVPQSIATIFSTKNPSLKQSELSQMQQTIASLNWRSQQLYSSYPNAKEYLGVFRRELQKLTSLYKTWSETL